MKRPMVIALSLVAHALFMADVAISHPPVEDDALDLCREWSTDFGLQAVSDHRAVKGHAKTLSLEPVRDKQKTGVHDGGEVAEAAYRSWITRVSRAAAEVARSCRQAADPS